MSSVVSWSVGYLTSISNYIEGSQKNKFQLYVPNLFDPYSRLQTVDFTTLSRMVLESFDQIIVSLQESNSTQSVESIDHAIAEVPGQQVSEKKNRI